MSENFLFNIDFLDLFNNMSILQNGVLIQMIRDIEVAEKQWKKTNDPEDARELLDVIFEHYLTLRGKQKNLPITFISHIKPELLKSAVSDLKIYSELIEGDYLI